MADNLTYPLESVGESHIRYVTVFILASNVSHTHPSLPPAALTENGVLADYLKILKDMKTQVNHMQAFLEAHIDLLENSNKAEADHEPNRGFNAVFVLNN